MGFELEIIHWLQSFSNLFMDTLFKFITLFGEEVILIVILGFLYWSYDKKLGEQIGFTVFISLALNSIIKWIVSRPRPFEVDSTITAIKPAEGFSFPSGHTQTASTTYFSLYAFMKKKWLLWVAIAMTVLVAISRMYLGVHYLSDVIVGGLLGVLIAFLMAKLYPKIKNINQVYQWMLILSVLGLFVVLGINLIKHTSNGVLDSVEFYNASEAVAKMLGTMFGFIIAVQYEKKHVNFENHNRFWHNIARFALGLTIIMAIRLGLKVIFTAMIDPTVLSDNQPVLATIATLFDFIRYTLMLFIGIGVYPKLFRTLHI